MVAETPVTWLILAVVVAVWFGSEIVPHHAAVGETLGASGLRVAKGQWWRLFTPGLLNTAS